MTTRPLTVAWFPYFPVEWMPEAPEPIRSMPKMHAASWLRVLEEQLEGRSDLRLHIVALRREFERDFTFERNGVVFHLLKTPGGVRTPSLFWVDTFLIGRLLRKIKPDVVHAWGTEQGAALVAHRLGYPRVVTVQGLLSWYKEVAPQGWQHRLAGMFERYSLPRSPLVTTESNFSVRWLRERFPQLRVEQIEHAPDPVFHRVQRQPQLKPVRFIFVGLLDFRKGADLLCRALDGLRNELAFELVLVGKRPSDLEKSLLAGVSPEFWQRVVFKESLTHGEVAEELSRATLMICPSRADVSPNSVKEAVVAGVPVVGSAVGGIPDYVWPGQNGVLFPAGDVGALAEAIRAACRHPLFGQGRVEEQALRRGREYLSAKLMGNRFREIYQIALQQGTAASRARLSPPDASA